jgi:phosphoserine aminotransferase
MMIQIINKDFLKMHLHNFNSGPAILPQAVLEQAAAAIHNFNNTGLSILEIGHRTTHFVEVVEEAKATVKRLMDFDDAYEVLFLQGGATMQFMQVPMNLLDENGMAAICDNGVWGNKAVKEAKLFGHVNVVASSEDKNYSYLPKGYAIPADAKYFHCTSNNTIYGTEMFDFPNTNGVPLICDMSSDIFSRPDLLQIRRSGELGKSNHAVNQTIPGCKRIRLIKQIPYWPICYLVTPSVLRRCHLLQRIKP